MSLTGTEIAPGITSELGRFHDLLLELDDAAWTRPSRCEGWTVADVSAHVVGSMADVVDGHLEGLGSPEVTAREVEERKGRTPAEMATELADVTKRAQDLVALFDDDAWNAPAPGGYPGTLAQGVEALWYDTWAHGDDIRAALGKAPVDGPGMRAGLYHVAEILGQNGWGPATLELDGLEEIPIGAGGDHITGDPRTFLMVATGRGDPGALGFDETVNIYR